MRRRTLAAGFSLLEVMIATVFLVVGLMAVVGTATTQSLLRKRGIEEDRVFAGMVSRMEWIRGELFSDSALYDQVAAATAGGGTLETTFALDEDGDGVQDVSAAAGDDETPVLSVAVSAAPPYFNSERLLQVVLTANWYGASGNRTLSLETLVSNRSGYDG